VTSCLKPCNSSIKLNVSTNWRVWAKPSRSPRCYRNISKTLSESLRIRNRVVPSQQDHPLKEEISCNLVRCISGNESLTTQLT
jgi:hypothetical protein